MVLVVAVVISSTLLCPHLLIYIGDDAMLSKLVLVGCLKAGLCIVDGMLEALLGAA